MLFLGDYRCGQVLMVCYNIELYLIGIYLSLMVEPNPNNK